MKKLILYLIIFVLALSMLFPPGGTSVQAANPEPESGTGPQPIKADINSELPKSNGQIAIYVAINKQWLEAGTLAFDQYLEEKSIELDGLLPPSLEKAEIRLVQKGGGAAHLDSVFLGEAVPAEIINQPESVRQKLVWSDYDVLEIDEKGLELTFSPREQGNILTVRARIEGERISQIPFEFPLKNTYTRISENSTFYTYKLNSQKGSLSANGNIQEVAAKVPFMQEYVVPGTGHPPGDTYAWVMNDDKFLYVAFDFTPDNTMDGDKDYAKVYVKTPQGLKEFKVSVPETRWGLPGFTYTGRVGYQHKVYEFAIPLEELGVSTVIATEINLAFSAYGTAAPPSVVNTNPGDYQPNVPVNSDITITYDLLIAAGTAINDITIYYFDDSVFESIIDYTYTINDKSLIIDPNNDLNYSTTYHVFIPENAVYNVMGGAPEVRFNFISEGEPPSADDEVPAWTEGSTLAASNVTQTSLKLTWSAATDNVGVTGYRIYRGETLLDTISGAVNSYDVTGLTVSTAYTFKVEAVDEAGNWSTNGPSTDATTLVDEGSEPPPGEEPDDELPAWPEGSALTASHKTRTGMTLTWSEASDNTGVTGYRIYKNGSIYTTVDNVLTTGITGLSSSTTYTFKVEAVDAAGNWSTTGPTVNARTALPAKRYTPPVLPKPATVTGTVSGINEATGILEGLAGIKVEVSSVSGEGSNRSTLTATDGSYTIANLAPGSYKIQFEGPEEPRYLPEWFDNRRTSQEAKVIQLDFEEVFKADAIIDLPSPTIKGTLTGLNQATGKLEPLPGVSVYAFPLSGTEGDAPKGVVTAADGTYVITGLAPGNYKLEFAPEIVQQYIAEWYNNNRSWREAEVITIDAGEVFVADATIDSSDSSVFGAIKGTLTGINKTTGEAQALSGYSVYAFPVTSGGIGVPKGALTAADGSFFIPGLTPGKYKLELAPETWNNPQVIPEWYNNKRSWREAEVIIIAAGDVYNTQATMDMPLFATIKGTLAGINKFTGKTEPISGYSVYAFPVFTGGNAVPKGVITGADGSFVISGLAPGSYKVEFAPETVFAKYLHQWHSNKRTWREADHIFLTADQVYDFNVVMEAN